MGERNIPLEPVIKPGWRVNGDAARQWFEGDLVG
jgi:hypothetical protein